MNPVPKHPAACSVAAFACVLVEKKKKGVQPLQCDCAEDYSFHIPSLPPYSTTDLLLFMEDARSTP